MRALVALALVGAVVVGCGPKKLVEMKIQGPDQCVQKATGAGLALCATAIFNGPECEAYYGLDLVRKGYLPVQVTLHNTGEGPFSVQASAFELTYHGQKVSPTPAAAVYEDLKASVGGRTAGWGIAFGVIGGVAAYNAAKNRNEALNTSLYGNDLKDTTLPAGQVMKAVVYFKIPDHAAGPRGAVLRLQPPSAETAPLDIDLREPAEKT